MIISKLVGGLGNQMFQYAAAFVLSKHHNVPLKMDNLFHLDTSPRSYRFEYRPYALDIFNTTGELASKEEIKGFTTPRTGNKYWYHFKKRIIPSKNVFSESQISDYKSLLGLPSNAYLEGYFQKYQYFSSASEELKKEFVFKDKVPKETLPILNRINETNSVCVVFRRGDYVGHPFLDIITMEYYYNAIEKLSELTGKNDFSIFVFSDDISWCIANFNPKRGQVCFVDQKHTGEKGKYYLQMMTYCKYFIIPNSTYPYWAAFLAMRNDKIVIAPKKWYLGQVLEINPILPPEWVAM